MVRVVEWHEAEAEEDEDEEEQEEECHPIGNLLCHLVVEVWFGLMLGVNSIYRGS